MDFSSFYDDNSKSINLVDKKMSRTSKVVKANECKTPQDQDGTKFRDIKSLYDQDKKSTNGMDKTMLKTIKVTKTNQVKSHLDEERKFHVYCKDIKSLYVEVIIDSTRGSN